MYKSIVQRRGTVPFPMFMGDRIYMLPLIHGRVAHEHKRWQPTIDAMINGINIPNKMFLMVDEKYMQAGTYHRRPGPHIDGYWVEGAGHRGEGQHGGTPSPSRHGGGGHRGGGGGHAWAGPYTELEAILLASNVSSCTAYEGQYEGEIKEGGSCESINLSTMKKLVMDEYTCYAGNVTMVHESMPVTTDCFRQLVRINVPHWSPELH